MNKRNNTLRNKFIVYLDFINCHHIYLEYVKWTLYKYHCQKYKITCTLMIIFTLTFLSHIVKIDMIWYKQQTSKLSIKLSHHSEEILFSKHVPFIVWLISLWPTINNIHLEWSKKIHFISWTVILNLIEFPLENQ